MEKRVKILAAERNLVLLLVFPSLVTEDWSMKHHRDITNLVPPGSIKKYLGKHV